MKSNIITAALLLAACDPVGEVDGLDTTGDPQPPPALDSTGGDPERIPDGDSTGSPQWALDSTGAGEACVLHDQGAWCRAQLNLALELPCSAAPDERDCLETIVALWSEGDADLLDSLDCDPSRTKCQAAYLACSETSPAPCVLADVQDCADLALAAGIAVQRSRWTCERLAEIY